MYKEALSFTHDHKRYEQTETVFNTIIEEVQVTLLMFYQKRGSEKAIFFNNFFQGPSKKKKIILASCSFGMVGLKTY
jgi:hypothetical protein